MAQKILILINDASYGKEKSPMAILKFKFKLEIF